MTRIHREAAAAATSLSAAWVAASLCWVRRAFGRRGPAVGRQAGGRAATIDPPVASGRRVLVVDDNPSEAGYTAELVRCWGITPVSAADGAEAVALAAVDDFDLILMDLQMPVLDGLSATKQIRAREREAQRQRAPVLAHTSCAPPAQVLRACGVDGVLQKPAGAETLHACLLRWCHAAHAPGRLA